LAALRVAERDVLLLFKKGGSVSPTAASEGVLAHDGSGQLHLALSIAAADLDPWRTWLAEHHVAIEREIAWDGGSQSLYFRDPDGHLLELATPGIWSLSW